MFSRISKAWRAFLGKPQSSLVDVLAALAPHIPLLLEQGPPSWWPPLPTVLSRKRRAAVYEGISTAAARYANALNEDAARLLRLEAVVDSKDIGKEWRERVRTDVTAISDLLRSLVEGQFATAHDAMQAMQDLQRQVQEHTKRLLDQEFELQQTLIAGMQTAAAASNPPPTEHLPSPE